MLAGGTDLMVEINEAHRRLTGDETVVAVGRVPELRTWIHDPAPATRAPRRRRHVRRAGAPSRSPTLLPALAQAARTVGSPQIRNAATIGGNLATCSPAGDGLPVLAALDADGRAASVPTASRTMPVARVHDRRQAHGPAPGELITAVTVPAARRLAGLRQGRRAQRHGDRHRRRLPRRRPPDALGAHRPRLGRPDDRAGAATPRRSPPAAVDWDARRRRPTTTSSASASSPPRRARPIDDHRATAAYRRRAVEVLARRLLRRALPGRRRTAR